MNIFFLDFDVKKCAVYHCDKHVVKMVVYLVTMVHSRRNMLEKYKHLLQMLSLNTSKQQVMHLKDYNKIVML